VSDGGAFLSGCRVTVLVMAYEFGKSYCGLCIKRPEAAGGNDSCPIGEPLKTEWQSKPNSPNSCGSFRLGDARWRKGPADDLLLFQKEWRPDYRGSVV
jgi:hypothetical protein